MSSFASPCGTSARSGSLGIELVVTDLDGTLWDGSGLIHPRARLALAVLGEASVPVLAATGRRAGSAWAVMEANGLAALPGVFLDGAIGRESGASAAFHKHPFSPAVATEVLEILDERGISPCINVDDPDRDIVLGDKPFTRPEYIRRLGPAVREEDPWTAVRTFRVLAFTLLGADPSLVSDLAAYVTARTAVAAAVSVDRTYGGLHLSLRPFGVSKWSGVLAFCAAKGIDPGRVLAVGDADNDVEMLSGARLGLAVADGTAAALASANQLLPPASEGGWAEILAFLGLSGGSLQLGA